MSLDANMPHYIGNDLIVRGRGLDFVPAFIPDGDAAGIAAARNKSFFENDKGAGQIVNGEQVYWQSKADVLAAIIEQIALAKNEFTFDPSVAGASPVNTTGNVKELDRFFVKKAGSWGGLDLVPGDILVAVNDVDIAGGETPTAADFVKNEGASDAVNEATTALAGTVFLDENTIALDSSEQHTNRIATRKAIADTFIAVRTALLAQMAADKAELNGKITTNVNNISDLTNRVKDVEEALVPIAEKQTEHTTKLEEHDNEIDNVETRLDVLEKDEQRVIVLNIGNDNDVVVETAIPDFDLEDIRAYQANWFIASASSSTGYRPISPQQMEIVQSGANQMVRTNIYPVAGANEFQVHLIARCHPKPAQA